MQDSNIDKLVINIDRDQLLTETEHSLIKKLGECYQLFLDVVGIHETQEEDLAEIRSHIHDLQHAVMAQAVGRAFPHRYRLLGNIIPYNE